MMKAPIIKACLAAFSLLCAPPDTKANPDADAYVDVWGSVDRGEEATGNFPPGYMLVGIGGRVEDDRFVAMQLDARPILTDGSLGGAIATLHLGSGPATELYLRAPEGCGIVSIGMGASRDTLTRLEISFRLYDPTTRTFTGPVMTQAIGPGRLEIRVPPVSLGSYDYSKMMAGVGARVTKGRVVVLRGRFCPIP